MPPLCASLRSLRLCVENALTSKGRLANGDRVDASSPSARLPLRESRGHVEVPRIDVDFLQVEHFGGLTEVERRDRAIGEPLQRERRRRLDRCALHLLPLGE